MLYTYVILFSFRPHVTRPEIVLHCWVATIAIELCRMVQNIRKVNLIWTIFFNAQNGLSYVNDQLRKEAEFKFIISRFDFWNVLTFFGMCLHTMGFVLRWWFAVNEVAFSGSWQNTCLLNVVYAFIHVCIAARLFFSIAVATFYIRLLKVYLVSEYLGPQLYVIKRMVSLYLP